MLASCMKKKVNIKNNNYDTDLYNNRTEQETRRIRN